MYLKIDDLEKNFIEFKTVKTNINDHLRFDDGKFISIKDILILDNKLYVTYTKNLNPAKNCLNLSVLRANVLQEGEKLKIEILKVFSLMMSVKGQIQWLSIWWEIN